ncbi:DUF6602 domain-containing protein [Cohnella fermenti]|uniref:DUF6602 domain-containing protein n=1 Tax=Cohnella fermenti TaxID=2565925 RepID=A0A4S4C9G4_9BACL|nr:DUF6602 domain-containing protein [Cohnella fermenti]THF84691.1 hypothetical protein E6C55_01600 [Cohnella fermenti]
MKMQKDIDRASGHYKVLEAIVQNYEDLAASHASQLNLNSPNSPYTTGSHREAIWKGLFEQIVPRKFCVDQNVFIIDSNGTISNEVDIAIFDEQYTPYIFRYGKIKYIPIEAVAVAIQCKSTSVKGVPEWAASIRELHTSLDSVARVISGLKDNSLPAKEKPQTSTRPILILCAMMKSLPKESVIEAFDIILNVNKSEKLELYIPKLTQNYAYWSHLLNHRVGEVNEFSDEGVPEFRLLKDNANKERTLADLRVDSNGEENVILSLTYQLNQLLMLINNPLFFPHRAYANLFKRVKQGMSNKTGTSGGGTKA